MKVSEGQIPKCRYPLYSRFVCCRYCGVSYLIHSEIKALEKKMKALEKELEHYKGCEERENQLKKELQELQDQRGEFEMNITVKDAA